MKKLVLVALVLLASAPAMGCRKRLQPHRFDPTFGPSAAAPAPVPLTRPPTPIWKGSEVTFAELPKARGSFGLQGLSYQVSFFGLPEGTKMKVGTQSLVAGASGSVGTKLDLSDQVAKLSPKDAFDYQFKLDPHATVDLELGPAAKLTLDLPPQSVSYQLAALYKAAPDTPVTIGGERPAAQHTVLLLSPVTPEALGPARTVADLDWVAVGAKQSPRTGKVCDGYKKVGDKKADASEKAYQLQMIDEKVTVYDVKTSTAIETKEFKAKDQCPTMVFNGTATSYVSSDEQKTWLRELRAKRK